MRLMRVLVATCAVLAVTASVAQADLVLINGTPAASFTDLGAQGFGNAPRMLTLQNSPLESGSVIPVDTEVGDAIDGANKSTTPTLSTLSWDSGAEVGIGFNSNQVGNGDILLNSLVLTIYAANGTTVLDTFSLAAPVYFSAADLALQQGNGQSVFNFGLDAAQQIQFNAIVANAGYGNFYAGLGASLGCPEKNCTGEANDGADSFIGFSQTSVPVPDGGSTATLLGSALVAFGMLRGRLRK